jgi:hypothetical protein
MLKHVSISGLKDSGRKKRDIISVGVAAFICAIWKARNLACFKNKWPREPVDVLRRIVFLIKYWCNLQVKEYANWSWFRVQSYWEKLQIKFSKQ